MQRLIVGATSVEELAPRTARDPEDRELSHARVGDEPHRHASHGVEHDCSWRMLDSHPDLQFFQHEARNYGDSPMQMSTMNFRTLPIMVWGMVVVDSCLQS